MSGDTLVFKVVETDDELNREALRMYVFYDHKYRTYGLRGGYTSTNTGKSANFSFYCDDRNDVCDYLHAMFDKFDGLTLALVNYPDLPVTSDKITYNVIVDQDHSINEIVGFDHTKNSKISYRRYLNILKNVYNDV